MTVIFQNCGKTQELVLVIYRLEHEILSRYIYISEMILKMI